MKKIKSVLVANRGEIAVRVIRACQELGIAAIAVVSEADRESLPARMADRVLCIGPAQATKSYLDIPTLVAAALGAGADAIHPGYGFLAERPDFAETCVKHGLIFIGPKALHIRQMGDKLFGQRNGRGFTHPGYPRIMSGQGSSGSGKIRGKDGVPIAPEGCCRRRRQRDEDFTGS